jgi:chromosome segregation ATPase
MERKMELGSTSKRSGVKTAEAATTPETQQHQDDQQISALREGATGLARRPTPLHQAGGSMATQVTAPVTKANNRLQAIKTEITQNERAYQDITRGIERLREEIAFNNHSQEVSQQEIAAVNNSLQTESRPQEIRRLQFKGHFFALKIEMLERNLQTSQAKNEELKNSYKALLIEKEAACVEVDTAKLICEFEKKDGRAQVTAWLETSRIASESGEPQVMPLISQPIKGQPDRDLPAELQMRLNEAWPY